MTDDPNNGKPPVPLGSREVSLVDIDPSLAMHPAMMIWFVPAMFETAKEMARYLSKAEGIVPRNLIGHPESCFAVVTRSLAWKLDPFAVAAATYETPGGRVGFEGKLCQAALENSGKIEGNVTFEHYGDWSKVQGKYVIAQSQKGNDYAKATWTNKDAEGLGVIVSAQVKGEAERRELKFDLIEAYPRNSTLWATSPKRQICYTAVRAFANSCAPGLFMGVDFDREATSDDEDSRARAARDITPAAPTRDAPAAASAKPTTKRTGVPRAADAPRAADLGNTSTATAAAQGEPLNDESSVTEGGTYFKLIVGGAEVLETDDPKAYVSALMGKVAENINDRDALFLLWEQNSPQFHALPEDILRQVQTAWPKPPEVKKESASKPAETKAPAAPKAPTDTKPSAGKLFRLVDNNGEVVWEGSAGREYLDRLIAQAKTVKGNQAMLDGLWEANAAQFADLGPLESAVADEWVEMISAR